jgi:hypothetical protein
MDQEHESRVIHVEIHGQRYPIRSALEGQYVAELAAFVDEKMRLAATTGRRRSRIAPGRWKRWSITPSGSPIREPAPGKVISTPACA